jgi:Transposase DDE domain
MAQTEHTPHFVHLEGAITVLLCLLDDAYAILNPERGRYESLKRLSDSEVITLALFQQLRGIESERSFLRDAERFFSHLFPGALGIHPSSYHRRVRKLRRYLEPLRRTILGELAGDPETLVVDSTLLAVSHPRQVPQGSGFPGAEWVRWGSFSVYGVKLHLLCATNRVPLSYELTAANVADVCLAEELIEEAALEGGAARSLLGDLAYRSEELRKALGPRWTCFWRPSPPSGATAPGSKWRSLFRASRGSSAWARPWPPRSSGWPPGSRRRSRHTPTRS